MIRFHGLAAASQCNVAKASAKCQSGVKDSGAVEPCKGVLWSDESRSSVCQEVCYLSGCDIWRRSDNGMDGAVIQAVFLNFVLTS